MLSITKKNHRIPSSVRPTPMMKIIFCHRLKQKLFLMTNLRKSPDNTIVAPELKARSRETMTTLSIRV